MPDGIPDGIESSSREGCLVSLIIGIPLVAFPLVAFAFIASSLFYNPPIPTKDTIRVNRKSDECWRIDLNNDSIKDLIIENNGKYDVYYGLKDGSFRHMIRIKK